MGVISLFAWFILAGGVTRGPRTIEYVIPTGSAQRVAAGENIETIPAKTIFVVGDTLVLNNQDDADHQIGPFWVPAHSTSSTVLLTPSFTNYYCSVHSNKTIGWEVQPQHSLTLTLLPTIVLGLPLGVVSSLIARVVSSL